MKSSIKVEQFAGRVSALRHPMAVIRITATPVQPKFRHTVLVLDCSGSMYGSIEDVKADAKKFVAELGETDYVSVVIFSGHNEARRICGPVRCDEVGKNTLTRAITDEVHILSTTVFSEPLELVLANLRQADIEGMASQAVLFTDGCAVPTRWGVRTEHDKSYAAVKALFDFGATVSTIGYGFHYDPVFSTKLAEIGGGIFRHMNDVEDFADVIRDIHDTFGKIDLSEIDLALGRPSGEVKGVYRALPEVVKVGSTDRFNSRGLFDKSVTFYVELASLPKTLGLLGHVGDHVVDVDVTTPAALTPELETECVRIIAAYSALSGDTQYAVELLTQLGEDGVAETLSESYTERERRSNADNLRRAFRHKAFIGAGLKPSGPNRCLVNLFDILITDPTVKVSMPARSYKRGGLLTRDPRIVDSPLGKTLEITGFVTHESRLNLSLGALKHVGLLQVDGTGKILDDQPAQAITIPRTYNLVRDGELVMKSLQISMSEESYRKLKDAGIIKDRRAYQPGHSYKVHLAELPFVSSAWARPNGMKIGELMAQVKELEAEQKALNARIKAMRGEPEPDALRPDFDSQGQYREQADVVAGRTIEYYTAKHVELRLMKYKVQFDESTLNGMTADTAEKRVRDVRRELRELRARIRTVTLACELAGWKTVNWGTPKTTARGADPKDEYLANIGGYEVKRVTWTSEVPCS